MVTVATVAVTVVAGAPQKHCTMPVPFVGSDRRFLWLVAFG